MNIDADNLEYEKWVARTEGEYLNWLLDKRKELKEDLADTEDELRNLGIVFHTNPIVGDCPFPVG